MVAQSIALLLCALIILRSIWNLLNLRNTLAWLSRSGESVEGSDHTKFIVCIPALSEQKIIVSTLNTFLSQHYPASRLQIYVVTTSKELKKDDNHTTGEVVQRYRATLPDEQKSQVHVVNYPRKDGRMAHQINFLAKQLKKELAKPNTYFVIYNADSNILPSTFSKVSREINNISTRIGRAPNLLQQSAVYQYDQSTRYKSKVAEGAGLHQTLWTLIHEIPRLIKQSTNTEKLGKTHDYLRILRYSRAAHCVGHGLFVSGSYYIKNPLPEGILNEDLPYGLLACAKRESIFPIPSLELASTPVRLGAVYKQKSVWFNPFFEFYSYGRGILKKKEYISSFELKYLVCQAYTPLAIWLLHSIVFLGAFATSLVAGPFYVVLWLVSFSLYWFVPAVYISLRRRSIDNGGSNSFSAILWGSFYVLSHSVGPLWAVVRWVRAFILRVNPDKPRTESA